MFAFALFYLKEDGHVFVKCRPTRLKYSDIDKIVRGSQNLSVRKLSQVGLTYNWKGHDLGQKLTLTQCLGMSSQMQSHDMVIPIRNVLFDSNLALPIDITLVS